MSTPNVLIVWQNPLFREVVKAILADAGIEVIAVMPIHEALARESPMPPGFVVVEGDREDGCALLSRQVTDRELYILAFSMDDDRAHLLQYRQWQGVTKDDIVQLLLDRDKAH